MPTAVDTDDLRRVRRAPEGHASVAAADVDDALAPDEGDATILAKLASRRRSQQRRDRREKPADRAGTCAHDERDDIGGANDSGSELRRSELRRAGAPRKARRAPQRR